MLENNYGYSTYSYHVLVNAADFTSEKNIYPATIYRAFNNVILYLGSRFTDILQLTYDREPSIFLTNLIKINT